MTLKPIEKANIDKTYFGIIADLSELFEDFIYCHDAVFNPNYGSITKYPDGYYFMSGDNTKVMTWLNWGSPRPKSGHLACKPLPKVRDTVLGRSMEGRIGSFSIIPWPHTGHALVLGFDSTRIAHVWLGFIPLENLPEIHQDNTSIWVPG